MKKRIISVLLILCLLLTSSLNISADTHTEDIIPDLIDTNISQESSVSATAAATPHGFLDSVGETMIGGWAWRSDIPNTPIDVHIYIKEDATGDEWGYPVTANGYRPDLYSAGYGNGYHAFNKPISWMNWNPGSYTIRAYGIGANGNNPQLINSPRHYTVSKMTGNVEYVNNIGVGGWAWKASAPNEPVTIHVYIRRTNGELIDIYPTVANQARTDLANAGYGNGRHGFTVSIDWSNLPKENLNVIVYAVDWTGIHPVIYNGYYDNRLPISVYGLVETEDDEVGIYYDRSTWATLEVVGYLFDIGPPSVSVRNSTNKQELITEIKESSFSVILTHGSKYSIMWRDNPNKDTQIDGRITSEYLGTLSSTYFADTKCLLLLACETGKGREEATDNIVNAFHNAGVQTVVGFERKIASRCFVSTGKIDTNWGGARWAKKFVEQLGKGKTVQYAKNIAWSDAITYFQDEQILDPEERYDKAYAMAQSYGLVDTYIAGNNQMIVSSN